MHIETTFTSEDYRKLSSRPQRTYLLFMLVLTALYLIDIFLVFRPDLVGFSSPFTTFMIALFGAPVVIVTWIRFFIYTWRMRQSVIKARQDTGTIKYDFNNDDATMENELSKVTRKWRGFTKWKKVGSFYILYTSPSYIWPVKASDIPDDKIQEFESLLTDKIGAKSNKR